MTSLSAVTPSYVTWKSIEGSGRIMSYNIINIC